jgi:tetratricopeptide (TPR) repeat protein
VTCAVVLVALVSVTCLGCGDDLAGAREMERAGDWEGALAVYQQVLTGHPEDLKALSGAAVTLMVLHRYEEALQYQERVVAADAADAQIRVELGFNYLNHQDRPGDAIRVFEEAVALERTAKNLTFLGQGQKGAGDQQNAERTLKEAIQLDPMYGYAYSQLVELLSDQGRVDEVKQVEEEARALGVQLVEP